MPIYEYQCQKCEKVHETIQKFSDPPLEKCEDCGGKLQKLISLSSFSLKGSGYYSTDYKKPATTPKKEEAKVSEPAAVKSDTAAATTSCGKSGCGHKH